jgi:hypothetical protein
LTGHHELSLKSVLTTQSAPFDVRMWVPQGEGDAARRSLCAFGCADAVRVEELDFASDAKGTPLEPAVDLIARGGAATVSDWVRTLVLARHGGVYFDLDVLFLRDLRPLCGVEFCYPWSDQPYGNSAVLHLFSASVNARALAARGARLGTCHPRRLFRFGELGGVTRGLQVLPVFTFDPAWIARDRKVAITSYCNDFDDFFAAASDVPLDEFFPRSYAYHWHNRWNVPLRDGSLAGRFHAAVGARFADMAARAAAPVAPAQ